VVLVSREPVSWFMSLADLWSSRLGLPALLGQHNRIVTENS
jgi:hypothetical protein